MSTPQGIDGGEIHVDVVADTTGLERDLQTKVSAAAARVKAKIQVEADTATARAQIKALETSSASRIKIQAEIDDAKARAQLAALGKAGGGVTVNLDLSEARAQIDAFRREQAANKITIKVDADTSAATRSLAALRAAQAGLSRGASVNVGAGNAGGTISMLQSVAKVAADAGSALVTFGKVAGVATGVAELAGEVTNLAGAAVTLTSSLGPAVNLLGLLPAVATTVGQGILAAVAGFAAIPGALKAYQQSQQQAAQTAATNAKAQEAAAQRVKTAVQGVADAQRQAAQQAQASARQIGDAQTRLSRAVADGQEQIAQARQRVTDAQADPSVGDAQTRLVRAEQDARDRIVAAQRAIADARQNAADVAVASANAVQNAQNGVVAAEENLAARQAAELTAQQRLTQARKDAQRTLDELTLSLKGAALDEEDASLAVVRAKQRLDKVNRSQAAKPIDKHEADLAYREAVQRLAEVQQRNKELSEDAAKAQQAGVEGAATVVAAKAGVASAAQGVASAQDDLQKAQQAVLDAQAKAARDQADAQRKISDAQAAYTKTERDNAQNIGDAQVALTRARQAYARGVQDAQQALGDAQRNYARSVSDAQKDLGRAQADAARSAADSARQIAQAQDALASAQRSQTDTIDKTTAAQRNWETALKSLSPVAQEFVKFLADRFLPAIRNIQKDAQAGLLPGVQRALETLLPYADDIGKSLGGTAKIIGDLAAAAAKLITSGPFRRDFADIASTNNDILRSLGGAFLNLLNVFRNLAHEGIPLVARVATAIENGTARLRAAVQKKRDDGSLFALFEDAYNTAAKLGHILVTLGRALFNMGHAARPAGDSLLQSLSNLIDKFNGWTASPAGQQAMSKFFTNAANAIRDLGPPLGKIGEFLGKTAQMNGFADALNLVADALLAISEIPGFPHVVDFFFKAAGFALVLGGLLKLFRPFVTLLTAASRVKGIVLPSSRAGAGAGGAGAAGPAPATGVQRVTWGPNALPVRVVGGAGGGTVGGDPFDPNDPMNRPAGGGGAGGAGGAGGTPATVTRRARAAAAARTAAGRVGRTTGITQAGAALGRTRAGAAVAGATSRAAGRVGGIAVAGAGRVTSTAGRVTASRVGAAAGRAGGFVGRNAGPIGLVASLAGGLVGDAVAGNAPQGSTRSILGNAIGQGAQFAGIGAMIGSLIAPGIGTAIGAGLGGVGGIIYGAIQGGLKMSQIIDLFKTVGSGIRDAWDATVGKLVTKVAGWWDDITSGAQRLYDDLIGHSIIPDLVKGIQFYFDLITFPIRTLIHFFTVDIPGAGQAMVDWFTKNWPAIEGIIETPIRLARQFIDTAWGAVRKAFSDVLAWVTAPASWDWGKILATVEAPIVAFLNFLTGRGTGWAVVRQAFADVLTWVTSPGSWNWGRILDTIEAPIRAVISFLTGRGTGMALIRGAFSDLAGWVTGAFKLEWAGIQRILTDPIGAARDLIGGAGRSVGGILGAITGRFSSFVSGAGDALSGLRGVWATPIRFVLDTVINRGLIGAFNFLAGKLPGLNPIHSINIPDALYARSSAHPGGYARGGILPGYTPGRDVHRFYSPTAGTLDLSGGEPILRPEAGRVLGASWVDGINTAARTAGTAGVQRFLGGYQGGGILGALGSTWNAVKGVASGVKRAVVGGTDALGSAASALTGILTDPVGWIEDKIKGPLGQLGQFGNTFLGQAAAAVPRAIGDALVSKISDAFSGLFGGGGPMIWPVGKVPLGPGFAAAGGRWGHTGGRHTGQDFEVPDGTPVHPAWAGVVQVVRSLIGSYGNYVEMQHGANLHSLYAHLSRILVNVGDRLAPTDVLGLSGHTGNATGPHLHFEVRTGTGTGTPVDPMPYLRGQIGGAVKGGVGRAAQWGGQVAQALAMLGQPQTLTGAVERRIDFESGGNPDIVNTTDCLTLDAMILTQRGWLKHDEVQAGDLTIGYNLRTGRSEWTPVLRVVHYADAPLLRMSNSRWSVTSTPNHRWVETPRVAVRQDVPDECPLCPWPYVEQPAPPSTCPECGWVPRAPRGVALHRRRAHGIIGAKASGTLAERPRRRGQTTTGGVQIHLALVHGVRGRGSETAYGPPRYIATSEIRPSTRLMLAAQADTGDGLPISVMEAELLGWIAGDGHVEHGRKSPSMSIAQSKPGMVVKLRALLADIPHAVYTDERLTRTGKVAVGPRHQFRLGWRYAQDLLGRAGNPKTDAVRQVLRMSADQRAAWLQGFTDAEGHIDPLGRVILSQRVGEIADAATLAVYLEGRRPRIRHIPRQVENWAPTVTISSNVPYLTGDYLNIEDAGRGDVWCVTTGLGTWTARQDDHIFLTGNSNWRAGHPSVGLMQVIADTYRAYIGPLKGIGPFSWGVSTNPLANIYAGLNYALHRYGSIQAIDPLVRHSGYDQGGPLYPGDTLSHNGTGKIEATLTDSHAGRLLALVDRLPEASVIQNRPVPTTADLVAALRNAAPVQVDVHPVPGMSEVEVARRVAYELEWARR